MGKKKNYKIPKELLKISAESNGYLKLRELYVKLPFGYKKAVKCSVEAEKLNQDFFIKAKKLYPELKGKSLQLREDEIYILEDKKAEYGVITYK